MLLTTVITAGTYYPRHTELPTVIPFVIFTIIIYFILLPINIMVINNYKTKS